MLAIELPKELEDRLAIVAKEAGRSSVSQARRIILDYLEDLEDAEIAEKALDEFYKSGEKAIPMAEMMKKYGLDDWVHQSFRQVAWKIVFAR